MSCCIRSEVPAGHFPAGRVVAGSSAALRSEESDIVTPNLAPAACGTHLAPPCHSGTDSRYAGCSLGGPSARTATVAGQIHESKDSRYGFEDHRDRPRDHELRRVGDG